MKISRVESRVVRLPADEPLAGGPATPGATRDFVVLRLGTDEGVEGLGYTFFGGALTPSLKSAVDSLGALTIGEDPMCVEAIAGKLKHAAGSAGPGGIFTLALAAVDIALWDIKGKALGVPVAIGARLEDCHLYWLEDVVAADDYPGLASVASALATPIAAGEYVYGKVPFRHLLEARSVDIVMIDVLRAGGITQWLKIAGMAEAFNLPVVNHLCPEISVHLVAAIPNGLTVEYMPWSLRLFKEAAVPVKGELVVPAKPGLGLELDEAALSRYSVAG